TEAALGRLDAAREFAQQHAELSERLSPHHRVHSLAMTSELDELAGRWQAIRERTGRVEALVAANAATPCVRNARTLLVCAMATASGGDDDRSRELEREAQKVRLQGHTVAHEGAEIRLALIRGNLARVERSISIDSGHTMTFGLMWISARLDGLAAL